MSLRVRKTLRVLARRQLVMGCEREPLTASAFLFGGVGLVSSSLVAAAVCVLLWVIALSMLRWMAKVDPQLVSVYRRSLQYRRHYPAYSRPYRKY